MRERVWLIFYITFAAAIDAITTKHGVIEGSAGEASPVLAAFINTLPSPWATLAIFTGGVVVSLLAYGALVRVNKPNVAIYSIWGLILMQIIAATNNLVVISEKIPQKPWMLHIVYGSFILLYVRGIYIDHNRNQLKKASKHRTVKGRRKIEEVRDRLS